jgi:hypothetical protein
MKSQPFDNEIATMTRIEEIESVARSNAQKLASAGITTIKQLLAQGSTPAGRNKICSVCGIDELVLLKIVSLADMMRIKGVGGEISWLLEAAGVSNITELKTRNALTLYLKIKEINSERKMVKQIPSFNRVESYISQAKHLNPVIIH